LIETTIEELISGVKPNMINRIRVCIIDDKIHSLDNRRLHCFQEAIRREAEFKTIPVTFVRKDGYHEENVGWKMDNAKIIVKN